MNLFLTAIMIFITPGDAHTPDKTQIIEFDTQASCQVARRQIEADNAGRLFGRPILSCVEKNIGN